MIKKINTTPKIVVASALGIALLLGGSTYALWSANAPVQSAATITSGDLQVSSATAQTWTDISNASNPVTIPDLSNFLLSPGDTIQLKQDLNVIVVGNNISGTLQAQLPNNTASASLLAQAKFTLAILDKDGKEINSITPATNTLSSLDLSVSNLKQTAPAGEKYTVVVTVELPADSTNNTKTQIGALANMTIILDQGDKYVAPFYSKVYNFDGFTDPNAFTKQVAAWHPYNGQMPKLAGSATGNGYMSIDDFPPAQNVITHYVDVPQTGASYKVTALVQTVLGNVGTLSIQNTGATLVTANNSPISTSWSTISQTVTPVDGRIYFMASRKLYAPSTLQYYMDNVTITEVH